MFCDIQLYSTNSTPQPKQGDKVTTEPYLLADGIFSLPQVSLIVPGAGNFTLLNTVIIEFTDIFDDCWWTQWCYLIIWQNRQYKIQMVPNLRIRKRL